MVMKKSPSSQSVSWRNRQQLAQKSFPSLKDVSFTYGLDISSSIKPFDYAQISTAASHDPIFALNERVESGISVMDYSTASAAFPFVDSLIGSLLSSESKLELFHLSNVKNVLVMVVPENTHATSPIAIVPGKSIFEHVFIFVGKNSRVSFVHLEKDLQKTGVNYRSSVVEIFAEENAHVAYSSIQSFSSTVERVSFKRSRVSTNARVDWFWSELGSSFVKSDVSSFLVGENASSQNVCVHVQNNAQIFDLDARAIHTHPQTKSTLLSRGVLDGESKNVYKGLIRMTKDAPHSHGEQRADVLVLSPTAEADPVPMLEIEGSDIQCSHAATVSRLDASKLFYLSSRGLDDSVARALYIYGFLDHALSRFPSAEIISESRSRILRKLGLSSLNVEESLLVSPPQVMV
ncbi:MAG: SufD family Fe-S cluster assembly protein [Candidatus Diapherotrites archaeon]|uniref:SufD family Fe-S cluster assembly protein n=1 Tax=Candidatus Iainarchaeum sp. TaxID=3101447 RepID=A0A8T4C7R8_9ARCH|nr:SufD family Fe-S cluster assembly protein [Candidatus Diapherotrites archaeon]